MPTGSAPSNRTSARRRSTRRPSRSMNARASASDSLVMTWSVPRSAGMAQTPESRYCWTSRCIGRRSPGEAADRSGSPGGGSARGIEDRVERIVVEDVAVADKPSSELHARDDAHPVRGILDGHVVGVDRDDEPFDMDREPGGGGEELRSSIGFVAAVADVGLPIPIDKERAPTDPDLRAGMMLGVHGEDAARADDQVVDVRASLPDRDGMQEPPPRVLLGGLGQLSADFLLAVRTDPPRPFVGVHPQGTGKKRLDRGRLAGREGLFAGFGARAVRSEVDPGAGRALLRL